MGERHHGPPVASGVLFVAPKGELPETSDCVFAMVSPPGLDDEAIGTRSGPGGGAVAH